MTEQTVADDMLGRFARQQHDWFERVRKGSLDPEEVARAVQAVIDRGSGVPAIGEEFDLTLDGDVPENGPIEMVRGDGYDPRGWKHKGKRVKGTQTRSFKLVEVGYCRNLDEVKQKLSSYGEVPEGQWRQAFKARFSKPCGRSIGVADALWGDPDGSACFPCVGSNGGSRFSWADGDRGDDWVWLVEVRK